MIQTQTRSRTGKYIDIDPVAVGCRSVAHKLGADPMLATMIGYHAPRNVDRDDPSALFAEITRLIAENRGTRS